jgi:uncharacterized YigZ family protein
VPADIFLTLAGPGSAELRVRGSTFLGHALPVDSEEAARERLAELRTRFWDATHNCSAWRLRSGPYRASDDGEPSGSAGLPILAAIEGADLVDCLVVVTRYFGGTRLGVGGLVRSYGDAAAAALAAAPRRTGLLAARVRVRYAYGHTGAVMRVLELVESHEVEHGYAGGGAQGELVFSVARDQVDVASAFLVEATGAEVVPEVLGERVVYRGGLRG